MLSVSFAFTFCGSRWLWYSNKNNFVFREEILLAAISEKDNQIGHLELQNSKNRRTEIKQLKSDKEQYVKDLKEQVYFKDYLQILLLILSKFNPLQPGVADLNSWKHQKTFRFCGVFGGYR